MAQSQLGTTHSASLTGPSNFTDLKKKKQKQSKIFD
jgi:hypothetical protein